jgi:hypothetical protein
MAVLGICSESSTQLLPNASINELDCSLRNAVWQSFWLVSSFVELGNDVEQNLSIVHRYIHLYIGIHIAFLAMII